MYLSQLIEFIGHFMGAVLQLILIMMMARRKDKRRSENVFYTLVAAAFIWHAGNFVITFSELLTGRRVIIIGLAWDTAAARLIVEEAGGRVTRLSGAPFSIFDKDILASNGRIHRVMRRVLTGK